MSFHDNGSPFPLQEQFFFLPGGSEQILCENRSCSRRKKRGHAVCPRKESVRPGIGKCMRIHGKIGTDQDGRTADRRRKDGRAEALSPKSEQVFHCRLKKMLIQ